MRQNTDCWCDKGGESRLSELQFIRRFRKQRHCQRPERLISSPTAQILHKRPRISCLCHQRYPQKQSAMCPQRSSPEVVLAGRPCINHNGSWQLNRLLRAVGQAMLYSARIVFYHKMRAVSCLFRVAVNTFGGRSTADAIVTLSLCAIMYTRTD